MAMRADFIWMNGKIIPWDQAQVHVFTHALHYGSSVFEGIRVYETVKGPAIFRGVEHYERLMFSAKVARIPPPYTVDELMQATADLVRVNQQRSAYVRPIMFRGYNTLGVDGRGCPVETVVATVPWGAYLGKEGLEQGVDVQVSSWRRMAPDTLSALAKIGGQYVNSQNVVMEAKDNGFTEGIALDVNGYVSEGSGENIFLILKGRNLYAAVGQQHSGRHHPQLRRHHRPGSGLQHQGDGHPPRDALYGRRDLLHRHRSRDHAHPFCRSDARG